MNRALLVVFALVSSAAIAQNATSPPPTTPQIPFDSVPNVLKLPTDLYMGEAAGVAVNSKGHIFVFHRGGSSQGPAFANTAAQLWEFDSDGHFVREIGKNLYAWSFAHAVRIDRDDNIWAIDKGSDMIVRFNPEGRVTMVIGRKQEASDAETRPYEHVNPPLPPQNGRFRQPTDVTWDPAGNIFISDGYINSRVAKYDKNGDWVKSWGDRGDEPGKFNPEGRVVMVFGRKKEASDEGGPWTRVNPPRPAVDGQFRQPTDVTWDPEGNIFISDGYINSRVAKFDRNGDWVMQWGGPGNGESQFNTPHSIAADAKGNIYVADRGNRRIQVFDHNGKFLKVITIDVPVPPDAHPWFGAQPTPQAAAAQSGAPWSICITPGPGTQYLYSSDAFPGRVYKLSLDGQVLGMVGKSGRQLKQFGWIHEMACPAENEIYTAEILNWRVQKLTLHPGK